MIVVRAPEDVPPRKLAELNEEKSNFLPTKARGYGVVAEVATFAKKSYQGAAQWAAQANIEVAPPALKNVAVPSFFALGATSISLVLPSVLLSGATFL